MTKYEFKLAPAYCLYNGTAVLEQNGSKIKFLTEHMNNKILQERLKKAFTNHINFVISQPDCPCEFKENPEVVFFEGNHQQLKKCVSRLYEKNESNLSQEKTNELELENNAAAVILLDAILVEARLKKATDIHIEDNMVKFRVCGKLSKQMSLEEKKYLELIQRIKFLAGMNVLEKRRSQDGHFTYGKKNPLFIRVSTMPIINTDYTEDMESVVIRILDTTRTPLNIDYLGFNQQQILKINKLCKQKNGLIIICGPTGAGKSTTAASLLVEILKFNNNAIKIISLEDPPEYIIPGVTQIKIDEKINNSFANALVHVFRQDPDVLMIGEIRDESSASAAIRASLTGHLVIATLHTSSAAGAILRLENLGIKRNVIASVVKGVLVQEMNHLKTGMKLFADVALPDLNLQTKSKSNLSGKELEECFVHTVNYDLEIVSSDKHESMSQEKLRLAPLYQKKENEELSMEG